MKKHIIIIPVYNELFVVRKMLRSLIRTTNLRECTLCIIDDGSDTKTKNFLEMFVAENLGIYLARNQKNIGKPKSINKIMHLFRSADYFTILDSDIVMLTKN